MMKIITLLLIVLSQFAVAAEPIGRLFTSPNERSNLDYLRQTKLLRSFGEVNSRPIGSAASAN